MVARFVNAEQESLYGTVLAGLGGLGYGSDLIREDYQFEDWFSSRLEQTPELRTVQAAAFGRSPFSYDSACFAVTLPNGTTLTDPVAQCRALGAPLAFVVYPDRVLLWRVQAASTATNHPKSLSLEDLEGAFRAHAEDWKPENMLRAKNIGPTTPRQLDFIDIGLIPALEQNILEKLDPLLRRTFFAALTSYQERHTVSGRPDWLFRLVFRILAGKVMTDRGLTGFDQFIHAPDPNALIDAVNAHFGDTPHLNADAETRRLIVDRFWSAFSFRNMSVRVLSSVWENTLVDEEVRKELSIHGTPSGVARYIVKRLGFERIPEGRFIVEPCCGSGTFLLAAMQRLADSLSPVFRDEERHNYLRSRLAGFDVDTFGLEVARDCLMLADYPVRDHWILKQEDVFARPDQAPTYHECLSRASVVFCNPPFGKFTIKAKQEYKAGAIYKPVELLNRVLDTIPVDATLGFVMPHLLLSGQSYPEVRRKIAERFGSIEVVNLPDQGVFSSAEYETTLLIAREPRTVGTSTRVLHGKVDKHDWSDFNKSGVVYQEDSQLKTIKEAKSSLAVPELQAIWQHLRNHPIVDQATAGQVHRGIEWNISIRNNLHLLLSDKPQEGFVLGIPPSAKTEFYAFLSPTLKYLCFDVKYRRSGAFELRWDHPKVLMNRIRKGRGPWRLAAFADEAGGLTCYDTFTALWPTKEWSPIVLSAAMNGPVANAFIATHTVGRHVPNWAVKRIPLPHINSELASRIEWLVGEYTSLAEGSSDPADPKRTAERALLDIDAAILEGYGLPPRLERQLLDYFNDQGERRPVNHTFGDYFPADFKPTLPLYVYLSKVFQKSTAQNLLTVVPTVTDPDLIAALKEVE